VTFRAGHFVTLKVLKWGAGDCNILNMSSDRKDTARVTSDEPYVQNRSHN